MRTKIKIKDSIDPTNGGIKVIKQMPTLNTLLLKRIIEKKNVSKMMDDKNEYTQIIIKIDLLLVYF